VGSWSCCWCDGTMMPLHEPAHTPTTNKRAGSLHVISRTVYQRVLLLCHFTDNICRRRYCHRLDLDVTDLQLVIVERLPTPHRAFAATSASDQEHGPDSGTRRAGEQRKLGHRCIWDRVRPQDWIWRIRSRCHSITM